MSTPDETKVAEYVLGTMPADERIAFERDLARDTLLREKVRAWEERLAPLAASVAEVTPPADMYDRIERAIIAVGDDIGLRLRRLEKSRTLWRSLAIAASSLAAALALLVAIPHPNAPGNAGYIAVVDRGGNLPALIVRVDLETRKVSVQSLAAEAPDHRSLELWLIAAGRSPASLGVMNSGNQTKVLPAVLDQTDIAGASFAVSVEPAGGSPTGKPTGPVIYSGRLVPAVP